MVSYTALVVNSLFQFTHPGGVRLAGKDAMDGSLSSFNSRTREGCDIAVKHGYQGTEVSIHAPGRGATAVDGIKEEEATRFNSRTREGCDRHTQPRRERMHSFNSRTREGCDVRLRMWSKGYCRVSIHAPGRGATNLNCNAVLVFLVSIHAPGRGATLRSGRRAGVNLAFQFTHPGGVRHLARRSAPFVADVSIHAPGRGATISSKREIPYTYVSIHAPGRGATNSMSL